MLKPQRVVVTAALIVIFFFLLLQCMNFMKAPEATKPFFESFTSAGPTRPDDCLCLPGYVPSNTKESRMGGIIVEHQNMKGRYYYLPSGSRIAYWFPDCTIKGVNINFCTAPRRLLSAKEWDSQIDSFDKTMTKAIWDDFHKTTTTPTFFCQKLTDPSDTKACTVLSK